ncbi:hypothetical protein ACT4MW_07200 [Pseudomonas brassicacearum subsp. neoaurantiaca]|uniref:hypothetical protein n=1 Tax=Pseudomonas brassicacearum TaxID=930166 RepID=UPI0040373535
MEWLAAREVHISGGIRVLSYGGSCNFLYPGDMTGEKKAIQIQTYTSLFSDIRRLGLEVVGCDFFTGPHSHARPEWRIKSSLGSDWLTWDQGRDWSFIAHGAFKKGDSKLYDIATRISHQLRSCEWRVRQLSESYMDQLNAKLQSGDFKDGQRFLDGFTELCYLAAQTFLIDACTLRDYLIEFYWHVKPTGSAKITSIGSLCSHWKKTPPTDPHGLEIQKISSPGNWLDILGSYRNLIIHAAPLATAGATLYSIAGIVKLSNSESLPFVKLPLPSDPGKLKDDRNSGKHFDDPSLRRARFHNIIEKADAVSALDSLTYANSCLEKLSVWAASLAELSPVKGRNSSYCPYPRLIQN